MPLVSPAAAAGAFSDQDNGGATPSLLTGLSPGSRADGLDARVVRMAEHLSAAQIDAVRNAQPVAGLADAIEAVCNWAGARGMVVALMAGSYDLRRMVRLHPRCWLVAETPGSWPSADYNPGFRRDVGVVLVKNHNDEAAIYVQGKGSYDTCGGIAGISLSGDPSRTSSNQGDGLVIDRVGGYQLLRLKLFSIPRDGIVIGVSPGDVTGQIIVNDLYVNNVGRFSIRNRSKWLKATQVATDGGVCSYFSDNSPNADVSQFHFEGAAESAIILKKSNANTRFRGGYIGMTNRLAKVAVGLDSAQGNVDVTFRDIQLNAHPDLEIAIDIGEAAWRASILNCEISSAKIGVRDFGKGTTIAAKFLDNGLPIEANGSDSDYRGSQFVATRGAWGIEHRRGGGGIWTDIRTDRPFRSSAGGDVGTFGTNHVSGNPGFRTAFRASTPLGSSPVRVPHGMAVPPATIFVTEIRGRSGALAYRVDSDETAVIIQWPGGGARSFAIEVRGACESM